MAGVKILTAPPLETPLPELGNIRTARTHAMMRAGDVLSRLSQDCRPLVQLLDEAKQADWLGYSGRDEFIIECIGRPVDVVEMAVAGLDLFDPSKPVPFDRAVEAGAARRMAEAVPLARHGGDRKSEAVQDQDYNVNLIDDPKGGNSADYLAARIKRDRPDIAARVEAGEYRSIRAAAIDAGIVKPACPVRTAQRAFLKMTPEQQADFLAWCDDSGV
jgi:hypothetical protein